MPSTDPRRLAEHVGRRIGELRAARLVTQEQFAETAGVSLKYLQRVEAGKENLTLSSLARFADLLGVRVALLFRTPTRPKPKRGRPRRADRSRARPRRR